MRRVDALGLDETSSFLSRAVKENGWTKALLHKDIERAQERTPRAVGIGRDI